MASRRPRLETCVAKPRTVVTIGGGNVGQHCPALKNRVTLLDAPAKERPPPGAKPYLRRLVTHQCRLHSAFQRALAMTPNVSWISGRVVKRLGLAKHMRITQFAWTAVLRYRSV
jgi:hypothetical protein